MFYTLLTFFLSSKNFFSEIAFFNFIDVISALSYSMLVRYIQRCKCAIQFMLPICVLCMWHSKRYGFRACVCMAPSETKWCWMNTDSLHFISIFSSDCCNRNTLKIIPKLTKKTIEQALYIVDNVAYHVQLRVYKWLCATVCFKKEHMCNIKSLTQLFLPRVFVSFIHIIALEIRDLAACGR